MTIRQTYATVMLSLAVLAMLFVSPVSFFVFIGGAAIGMGYGFMVGRRMA